MARLRGPVGCRRHRGAGHAVHRLDDVQGPGRGLGDDCPLRRGPEDDKRHPCRVGARRRPRRGLEAAGENGVPDRFVVKRRIVRVVDTTSQKSVLGSLTMRRASHSLSGPAKHSRHSAPPGSCGQPSRHGSDHTRRNPVTTCSPNRMSMSTSGEIPRSDTVTSSVDSRGPRPVFGGAAKWRSDEVPIRAYGTWRGSEW